MARPGAQLNGSETGWPRAGLLMPVQWLPLAA